MDDGSIKNDGLMQGPIIGGHGHYITQHYHASDSKSTPPERAWNVPYQRNPYFTGREDLLVRLHEQLHAGQDIALSQSISGLGGVGKTQLAVEYAYLYEKEYRYVLWVRAESEENLIPSYVSLAYELNLPQKDEQDQNKVVEAIKRWFRNNDGWLLIFDNADEPGILSKYVLTSPRGHCLYTTRASTLGALAHCLPVESFTPEKGALFLLRRTQILALDAPLEQAPEQERELALQITHELGGLPLALDQAGAYIEEAQTSLPDYLRLYQQRRAELLAERGDAVSDHPEPVATTWSLSFQRVEKRNPAASALLRLCAWLAPDAIPEEIITRGCLALDPPLVSRIRNVWMSRSNPHRLLSFLAMDALALNQALSVLQAYSLIRRHHQEKTLSIHRLVQAVLQDRVKRTEKSSWAKRAMLAINTTFPRSEHGTWPQCERLLSHALLAAQYIKQYHLTSEKAGRLLHETATYLYDRGRYSEAELLFHLALRIREQLLGKEHLDVASSLNVLANCYKQQGKHAEAEPRYQQALHIRERLLGWEQEQVASPLNNLAILYTAQGRYKEAEPLFLRALHIWEHTQGPEHVDVLSPLNNLAILYTAQERYKEAEPLFLHALHIWEQQPGPERPSVAALLSNLADLYAQQGRYAEAEPLYQRALPIMIQQLGPEHPHVTYPLNGLANLYRDQGKYKEAEPLYQRALHIRERQLGEEHLETAETIHDLAQLREAQGNNEEARALYARALSVREQALVAHHPKTTETRKRLIALLRAMGMHEEAAQLEENQSET